MTPSVQPRAASESRATCGAVELYGGSVDGRTAFVGLCISASMTTLSVPDALEQAIWQRKPSDNRVLIHHSDRRSQYLSIKYSARLIEISIDPSAGTVGDSHEFKLVRASGLNDPGDHSNAQIGHWKSMREVEWEILKWVDWQNNRRLFGPIGYTTPTEAEEAFHSF